jgi:hypothetical protein
MAAIPGESLVTDTNEADFSHSMMLGPDHKIREGDAIDYEIVLRNTGSKRPDYVEVRNRVDEPSSMLASSPELSYDVEKRVLYWRGAVDPGEERRFTLSLVTTPKSAGTFVSNQASIVWGTWASRQGSSLWDIKTTYIECSLCEIQTKERTARVLFTVAGIEFGWLELILGYPLLVILFLILTPRLIQWRDKQRFGRSPDVSWGDDDPRGVMVYGMSFAFIACLAVVLFIASLVYEDVRKFSSYEETTCTVVDKKVRWDTGSSGKTKYADPFVSVRYTAKGREVVSAGSLAKGALLSSSGGSAEKTLAQYEPGKAYPCWFDPEDPREFLLTRGLSWGWCLLCLGPLILFLVSARYLLRRLRGPHTLGGTSKNPIHPG